MTLCALTPDRDGVWRYDDSANAWSQVGGPAIAIYGGLRGLVAAVPPDGNVSLHLGGGPDNWQQIGGPGATFAVAVNGIFGLTPNRDGVWLFDDSTNAWSQVGGPANWIYGGPFGLVATDPDEGNVFRYLGGGPGNWQKIGGPGATFAVTGDTVYGLTPNRDGVWRYEVSTNAWSQVGGPARWIYGGMFGLVATDPDEGNLFHYLGGGPGNWEKIGGPGASFAVDVDAIYGLTPDKDEVWRYDVNRKVWARVGSPAHSIVVASLF